MQNLGLLITLCGTTILHIGDTEVGPSEARAAGLGELRPDIALLPSWFTRPGRWTLVTTEVIRPHSIIAMHLPSRSAATSSFFGGARNLGELVALLHARFPAAWIPLETGQSRTFACHPTTR